MINLDGREIQRRHQEKISREQEEQRTRLMASQWAIAAVDNDLKKDKKKASRKDRRKGGKQKDLVTSKSQKYLQPNLLQAMPRGSGNGSEISY